MIRSFRHKGLQAFHRDGDARLVRSDLVHKVGRILAFLNAATAPGDMSIPGFRLHPLKGDLTGYWAVTVRANWRITFRFEGTIRVKWTSLTTIEGRHVPMKNPVHPGEIVRYDCLDALGLSVTDGARILGVSRQALNNLVNGKSGLSPEMAIRLEKAFGSTAETWLSVQLAYDIAEAKRRASSIRVRRYRRPRSAKS